MLGPLRLTSLTALFSAGVLSGFAAFAASVGQQLPEAALGIWPPAGDAYANASTLEMIKAVGPKAHAMPTNLPTRIAELARSALRYEPTNSTAMRNLGLFYESRGRHAEARAIMNAALATTRRDTAVNLWLTHDLGAQGKDLDALRLYDLTIRVDTGAAASLMTMMAQILQKPGAVPDLERLFVMRPPWLDDFWSAVLSSPGDLTPAFELRQRLHQRGIPMAISHDALLIERLANSGKFDEAFALYRSVAGQPSSNELLVDGDFRMKKSFPPFGWKVANGDTVGVSIDGAAGVLQITALPGADGVVAQQLVPLGGGGSFEMQADYRSSAQTPPLGLRLTCADQGGGSTFDKTFDLPAGRVVRASFATPCRYLWSSLIIHPDEDPNGRDIRVNSVSMRRETNTNIRR